MCSITGVFTSNAGTSLNGASVVEKMVRAMHHRGPDDSGIWQRDKQASPVVALGNTRLAILDLSPAGHMPMTDETVGLALTYNGEIYNYLNLREELDKDVKQWRSHTDTEVILRAYQYWGQEAWRRLRGMFAVGLWDERHKTLTLARGPMGIKPLYYYQTDTTFVFASEVRALLASGLVPRRLSREGVASFLHYGAVDEPGTIIEGVRTVGPGHYLIVTAENGVLQINEQPYQRDLIPSQPQAKTRAEAVVKLREILRESVRLHLASDVPLGLFLSGGIDSSALVALMSEVTTEKPKTFTVTFREKHLSEDIHARLVADKFKSEHTEILLEESRLLSLLPEALAGMDQPTQDGVNTFVVAQAVKAAGITVALSGLGGDELFAGYPIFQRIKRMASVARLPRAMRQAVAAMGETVWGRSITHKKAWRLLAQSGDAEAATDLARQLFLPEEVRSLYGTRPPPASAKLWPVNQPNDPVNSVSRHELQNYMTNTLLRDTDGMSMAHSLEMRVPFVDKVVVPFVLSLPGEWKLNGGRPKPLLLDALGDLLPDEIVYRKKMGFVLPLGEWLQSQLQAQVDTAFSDEARLTGLGLQPTAVRQVWHRFLAAPWKVGWTRPWALYVLVTWCALHDVWL